MVFRLFRASIWVVYLARLFFPIVDNYLGIIFLSQSFFILLLGDILLTFGFLMIAFLMIIIIQFYNGWIVAIWYWPKRSKKI